MTQLSLKPKKARVSDAVDAWWYDGRGGITVVIEPLASGKTCQVHIKRSALKRYLARSAVVSHG